MGKRAEYSDETKAQVMAALLTGQSIGSVARQYSIPKGTISNWRNREALGVSKNGTQKASLDEALSAYVHASLITLTKQVELFRDESWLKKQPASEVAVLHGVLADKAIRLLEAFGRASADEGETT
jgi:transposase-like protein